jgi:hypothetical protein
MSQQLINRSADLKRLRDEGYEVEVKGGYLLIHHIPFVDSSKAVKYGTLVSELTLSSNTQTTSPSTHVIHFIGDHPCNKDGSLIAAIRNASQTQTFGDGITINHSFSNKPLNGYPDYYQKVTRYVEIISGPAKSIDRNVTAETFKVIDDEGPETVFQYLDTNSSRANVNHLNSKFKSQKIAIIGLGGTGAYILDQLAKTPVAAIHIHDGDYFLQHNSFRSPGAASNKQLARRQKKVMYYRKMYSRIHKKIIAYDHFINEGNIYLLDGMTYVFICVDDDATRKMIMQYLLAAKIPFIDVGLGVNLVDDYLLGTVRVTTGTQAKNDHLVKRVSFGGNNDYSTNIQIADLNALNAILAVIKWKKMSGFYQDLEEEHHSTYSINVAQLLNEETAA